MNKNVWDFLAHIFDELIRRERSAEIKLDRIEADVRALVAQGESIMATVQEAMATIDKIDMATTKQGEMLAAQAIVLTAQGVALQEISDDVDDLLEDPNLPEPLRARLQAAADKAQMVSENLEAQAVVSKQQADFSKAIASKHTPGGVPPLPPVPPAPTPIP
jgi:chromosome segregation ATPase